MFLFQFLTNGCNTNFKKLDAPHQRNLKKFHSLFQFIRLNRLSQPGPAARTSTATGREGSELQSSEDEPLCVVRVSHRASASVASAATSAMRKHGARSGPEQPPAQERSDKPGASSCRINRGKEQRGDVKRAGASARTSEHDRASACQPSNRRSPPASHASHDCAVQSPAPRPARQSFISSRIQVPIQLRHGSYRFVSLVRDDIIPAFMALEDQPGIGKFPDMKQEIPAPEAGHLGNIRE